MIYMSQKTITTIGSVTIALLILFLILAIGINVKSKKNLRNEKNTSETRLFEKVKLEGNLEKLKSEFSVLKQQSDANAELLSESNNKMTENAKKINALSFENRSLRANKMELADLKNTNAELEKEFTQLKSERDRLMTQQKDIENAINSLEKEKNNLTAQLENTQLHNTDNFLVTATRGKKTEKVVICASRAKKLNMAFEVPQSLTEAISFKIVTPAGTTINSDDKAISWYIPIDAKQLTASLSSVTGEFEQSRQVVLNYTPKEKLSKGEYKIQILSDGNNIGNCRLMLR